MRMELNENRFLNFTYYLDSNYRPYSHFRNSSITAQA